MNRGLITVLGPVPAGSIGYTDAHNHLWIERVAGAPAEAPELTDLEAIRAELVDFRLAGGSAIVDCQPGGAGRNGRRLAQLARESGVQIIASTGFHRRLYYGDRAPLWQQTTEEAADLFRSEIREGLVEARGSEETVRPGVMKIAVEATPESSPRHLLEAACAVCRETGYAMEIHTEKGAAVERFLTYFLKEGVDPGRLVFCHVDKRPDAALHRSLADSGVMLEYDSFYRPKYNPEQGVWPLLEKMVSDGYAGQIALATDMADAALWQRLGNGPGLTGLLTRIRPRLQEMGLEPVTIRQLLGGNITGRLALPLAPQEEPL